MDDVKLGLIRSILNFLRDEFRAGNLDSENSEGLEVAIHCLEHIYNVNNVNSSNVPGLIDIYTSYLSTPMLVTKEEDKAEGEQLKINGNSAMNCGQFSEALEFYTRAIECNPKNPVYYCNRAAAKCKLNDYKSAISDCQIAIKLDPGYSKAYARIGLAYFSQELYSKAVENYKRALELEPNNDGYRSNLELSQEKLMGLRDRSEGGQVDSECKATTGRSAGLNPGDTGRHNTTPNQGVAGSSPDINLNSLLGNSQLVSAAAQMLTNPSMQNMLSSIINEDNGTSMQALLQAGHRLVNENPQFINQLSQVFNSSGSSSQSPKDKNTNGGDPFQE